MGWGNTAVGFVVARGWLGHAGALEGPAVLATEGSSAVWAADGAAGNAEGGSQKVLYKRAFFLGCHPLGCLCFS